MTGRKMAFGRLSQAICMVPRVLRGENCREAKRRESLDEQAVAQKLFVGHNS
jgi:hypothetical protein